MTLTKGEKKEIVTVALQVHLREPKDPTEVFRAIAKTKETTEWNALAREYYKKKETSIKELAIELLEDMAEAVKKIT